MKYRLLFFLMLMVGFTCYSYAESAMTLFLKTGSKVIIPLENSPSIEFDNGSVKIGNATYQISDIQKYVFTDALGISDIERDSRIINIGKDGMMHISKIRDASIVRIYDINGMEIMCGKTVTGDSLIVDITELISGNYILTIGNESIKFTKK